MNSNHTLSARGRDSERLGIIAKFDADRSKLILVHHYLEIAAMFVILIIFAFIFIYEISDYTFISFIALFISYGLLNLAFIRYEILRDINLYVSAALLFVLGICVLPLAVANWPGAHLPSGLVITTASTAATVCLSVVLWSVGAQAFFRDRCARPEITLLGTPATNSALARALSSPSLGAWTIAADLRTGSTEDLARLREVIDEKQVKVVLFSAPQDNVACANLLRSPLADIVACIQRAVDPRGLNPLQRALLRAGRLPFEPLFPSRLTRSERGMKRCFDLLLTLALIALVAPVLVVAAIAVRLESPGPVFFSQRRLGRGHQPIRVWKLRTMYADLGDRVGARHTTAHDPRVTKVGRILRRTSIDELPQLLNVLAGEMSLVGPRPHTPHMRVDGRYYFDAVSSYGLRHRVKPGITGWAQVCGSRGAVDTVQKAARRLELDLWYIDNWSLWLDLKIVLRTGFGGFLSLQAD
ncbi:exopolysaccharide biosynthesis polyprenyl glycosylphosphotransferase [Neoroseomonas oryzicola]|uniref:Exopolysaccharide biosynthesis polyprenyl glycosylphosphotransferase n=1 Tax=Neoroseomonas oryzicola TaxID=535904 RepID=A0A9X9WP71_9PROT|nr:exopolysaccharide biosynthesis polyprenyl glycosylphosphotransferase [Neoroseomonas oryzicola]MBR0662131.1 exopolysaccharide biosynthesis polyprenyl glycosylphosphotransferase [Neoroseomonas oryzicola]NKE20244.1 exopolysaccharide biosynthesis polyprenyl glycosylphosphotransferase [Neoroseomonas oryzicola]